MTTMRALLQYTLDLFEPAGPVDTAQTAPENIAHVVFKHPHADRQMRLGHALVGYRFQRARRRTIGFVIGPDGLVVRAPRWTPVYEVEAALREKSDWIVRKLVESRERHVRQQGVHITWRDGAELPYLGEKLRLTLDPEHAFSGIGAQLEEMHTGEGPTPLRRLRIALSTNAEASQIRDAVQAWLMVQARDHFRQRLDHFAPVLQVQWNKLSLSNAATRWGSARHDGAIRLNWRLIHFRQDVIDYVVVHELSHLRVMNHSPRFWDTVRTVVPDYATLRRQLKDDAIPRW